MRREKQWVHNENPIKIGCREVFSRAQVSAAGLFTLLSTELLFIRAMQALENVANIAFKHATQAQNPAVIWGGAMRFSFTQASHANLKGKHTLRPLEETDWPGSVRFVLQGTLAAFLNPCRLSAVRV